MEEILKELKAAVDTMLQQIRLQSEQQRILLTKIGEFTTAMETLMKADVERVADYTSAMEAVSTLLQQQGQSIGRLENATAALIKLAG